VIAVRFPGTLVLAALPATGCSDRADGAAVHRIIAPVMWDAEGASMKTVEAAALAREPGTCRGGSGCASERPPLRVLLPIVAVTGRAL
jgi:predicted outer membrane protein